MALKMCDECKRECLRQGYCGMEAVPLPGRIDSRDDVAVVVSNAVNPIALQGNQLTSLADIVGAVQPQIGSQVQAQKVLAALVDNGFACLGLHISCGLLMWQFRPTQCLTLVEDSAWCLRMRKDLKQLVHHAIRG